MDQPQDFYKAEAANQSNAPIESDEPQEARQRPASRGATWQAAEFIEHPHPPSWYATLFFATFLLAAGVYIVVKDLFATATIIVVGVIVGIFAGHKPRQVDYEISDSGLSINGKNYPFTSFKSFTVLQEGSLNSVNLLPLKRFMPPISAYFESKEEDKIVEALGNFLPYEDRKMDSIDRLSRRLRL